MGTRSGDVWRLGLVEYEDGLTLMERLVAARKDGRIPDSLFLLEHPHTLTQGRRTKAEHLLLSPAQAAALGVEIFETGRGGDVTWHGPGQIVGYPILDLHHGRMDAHRYVRDLEEVIIRALADFGVEAGRISGLTGVWVGQTKIAAIGVRLSRWVTSHGFALNVNADLRGFSWIVPCGISDRGVTSMDRLLGAPVDRTKVEEALVRHFQDVFETSLTWRRDIHRSVQVILVRRRPTGWEGLCLRRTPAKGGFWQPVTGHIEAGESPAETAAREAREETGLSGAAADLGYVHHVMIDPALAPGLPVPTVFEESSFWMEVEGEVHLEAGAHDAYEWLPLAAAATRMRWVGARRGVERVASLLNSR